VYIAPFAVGESVILPDQSIFTSIREEESKNGDPVYSHLKITNSFSIGKRVLLIKENISHFA
jgi:hypothetical protein